MLEDERDREMDQAEAGLLGEPRERVSRLELALVLRQREVEPPSRARWMILIESSWSGLPQTPNIIVPRQSGLTLTPVRPRTSDARPATEAGRPAALSEVVSRRRGSGPSAHFGSRCPVVLRGVRPGVGVHRQHDGAPPRADRPSRRARAGRDEAPLPACARGRGAGGGCGPHARSATSGADRDRGCESAFSCAKARRWIFATASARCAVPLWSFSVRTIRSSRFALGKRWSRRFPTALPGSS